MAQHTSTALGYTTLEDLAGDLAEFQLLSNNKKDKKAIRCTFDVPPFQRGYVWIPSQVELLWDSLTRGLPIGTLVASETGTERRYYLVDGRQRTTSLRLGFRDPFSAPRDSSGRATLDADRQALWVDINHKPDAKRMYLFRVTTSAHPWGYPISPDKRRLDTPTMRTAYLAYKALFAQHDAPKDHPHGWRSDPALLKHFLPWDANAPIPLSWLLDAIGKIRNDRACPSVAAPEVAEAVRHRFSKAYGPVLESATADDAITKGGLPDSLREDIDHAVEQFRSKLDSVMATLDAVVKNNATNEHVRTFRSLVEGLARAMEARIPVTVLLGAHSATTHDGHSHDESDPDLLLFERINRGGTPLSTDDLALSSLKANLRCPSAGDGSEPSCPEGLEEIETLRPAPTTPPRLAVTLVRALRRQDGRRSLLDRVRLSQLRHWLHSGHEAQEHSSPLQDLCVLLGDKERAQELLKAAMALLCGTPDPKSQPEVLHQAALPAVLAADLCNSRSRDLLALLLYWLSGPHGDINPEEAYNRASGAWNGDGHLARKTIGALTLLAWARWPDSVYRAIVRKISENLEQDPQLTIHEAFERAVRALGEPVHVPVFPPSTVEQVFRNIASNIDGKHGSSLFYLDDIRDIPETRDRDIRNTSDIVQSSLFSINSSEDSHPDLTALWNHFAQAMISKWSGGWRLLCYGQRDFLRAAYAWYDVADPDSIREHTVPWDYDHVVPNAWFYNVKRSDCKIPEFIKTWGQSIGNFRIWPAELNRSKRDDLIFDIADGKVGYNTASWFIENLASQAADISVDQLLRWSGVFLRDDERWRKLRDLWLGLQDRIARPDAESEDTPRTVAIRALANDAEAQKAFMEAVTARAAALYAEWYEQLCIGEILGEATGNR